MISAVFIFALLRTSQILNNENVIVTSYVAEDALGIDEVFEFEDSDFMIAFTLTDELTLEPKNDKRFVKWQAAYYTFIDDDIDQWSLLDVHQCTESDYEKFYLPTSRAHKQFERSKSANDLLCIKLDKETLDLWGATSPGAIWGSEYSGSFANIDIMAVPCHMGQAFWADPVYTEPADYCNWNQTEALSYMENLELTLFYNKFSFLPKISGDERV